MGWKDWSLLSDAVKERILEGARKGRETSKTAEGKKRKSAAAKLTWARPEYRARMLDVLDNARTSPERLPNLRKGIAKANAKPEVRAKRSVAQRKIWADNREKKLAGAQRAGMKMRGRTQPKELVTRRADTLRDTYARSPEKKLHLIENGKRLAASPLHHRRQVGEFSLSLDSRKKISDSLKKRWREHPDELAAALNALAKGRDRIRKYGEPTKVEMKTEKYLRALGLTFERECKIGPYYVDFALPNVRLALLVDGCFWHCCPEHFPTPSTKPQMHNIIIDRRRDASLKKAGWTVRHIWEHEVTKERISLIGKGEP